MLITKKTVKSKKKLILRLCEDIVSLIFYSHLCIQKKHFLQQLKHETMK
jgi:hypothetical protein